MAKWLTWLEQGIGGGPNGFKRVQTFRWLMLVGLTGVAFMILNSFVTVEKMQPDDERVSPFSEHNSSLEVIGSHEDQKTSQFRTYESSYENQLKEIIQNIVGVIGEVDVMVTIESTEELVVYRDEDRTHQTTHETDKEQATRQITEISETGKIVLLEVSGDQQPIVIKTIKPKIRGVVVVAAGVENLQVKQLILDTVSKGLEVPVHRISVVPRKRNES